MTQGFSCPFQPGEIINAKYRVEELIAVGGVGFVLSATHLHLEDSVALKLLKPEFATHRNAMRSFALEARASFRIRSEHIARVHDVDTLPGGVPFMVMELLRGEDLRKILMHYRCLPVGMSVDIALQTCEALAAAHAHQIVHRDIKPENLFVTQAGDAPHVKVLDFGISQVLGVAIGQPHTGQSPSLVAVGTPPYMSPEQIRGSVGLDARSDLWSLGCVLYEMLAGVAPFARSSVMQACAAVLEEEPAPLRQHRSVPAELDAAVMRCLSKDPSKRFANAAELAESLRPFGKHAVYCAQRCATLLAPPGRRSEPAQQPQLGVVARADTHARIPTGVAGRIPTGVAGRIPTGVAGRIPTGVAGRVPTGVAGRIPTGVAARIPTGVQAPSARVPTSNVALSSRAQRPNVDLLSPPLADANTPALAPVRRIPTAPVALAVPPPRGFDELTETDAVMAGLRPRRTGWLIFGASALIGLGFAYLALAQ